MYHQNTLQQGQQAFSNGPRPPQHQPPSSQHLNHSNMQRMGFQFPRPTQLPDELESALSARGARDMDHRQIDHLNRPDQHQNQVSASRMNQPGNYGSNPMSLPVDNPPAFHQGVDWSNFQPPAKLFAGPPPNVSRQSQQHHGKLQQPLNIQGGARVSNWVPPLNDSPSTQNRHPHAGGEGQNLYTPESAGSILASFGLSNEDLEVLSHYPDDQLTPDTLPFILRDIQINKSSNQNPVASTSTSLFSRSINDMPLPVSSSSLLVSPEVPSFLTVTQTAGKVIDYGHASRAKDEETFKREPLSTERTVKMYPDLSSRPSAPKAEKTEQNQVSLEASDPTKHGDRDYRRTGGDSCKNAEFQTSPKSRNQDRDYRCDRVKGRPSSEGRSEASFRRSLSSSSSSKPHRGSMKLPTPTMISDFSAVSPKVYPHTCSLCHIQCDQEKEWVDHVNTVSHTAACRDLRNKYPNWKPDGPSRSRQHGSRALWDPKDRSSSFSMSPSPSPRDGHAHRPLGRLASPHSHPRQHHYTVRRQHAEQHSGSHSPLHPHRPSSREHWLHKKDKLSSGGLPHGGLKRLHEDLSLSAHSSKHPPTKTIRAGNKPGAKTAVKAPPAKKKKVVTPSPKDSLVCDRLVYLTGIPNDASEQEVTDLACSFGKINNVILIPSCEDESKKALGQKASVCMMKAEDAQALCSSTNLSMREQIIIASGAQMPEVEQLFDDDSRKPEEDKGAAGNKSAEVNKKTSMKSTVLILGLPDDCSQSDILDLFQSFETPSDILLVTHLGKALVSVTDVDTAQEMIKVHSFIPAKVKDTEVKLVLIQHNVNLSTPVALFNLLMGSTHPNENLVRVGWSRLLVIRNVPDNPSGSSEVLKLVRRFGTVIRTLVLNSMVICEMATAAMALSVYKRFRMFPCIIHRNPLFFSRKPDPKANTHTEVITTYQELPEVPLANSEPLAAATDETAQKENPAPTPEGQENGGELTVEVMTNTEKMVEEETLGRVAKRNETITEMTSVEGGVGQSEAESQELPTELETEASGEDKAAPQETPVLLPAIPKMTQAMVNALLEECRIQTVKNTAAPIIGEQEESPMETDLSTEVAEETIKGKELIKEQESKVKDARKKPRERERERERGEKERRLWEKEERARRERGRSEKARRDREREKREKERRDRKRSRQSSWRDECAKAETEAKMEEEEDDEKDFPFNMTDFVTVDEVGEVTDLPSLTVTMETCEVAHPEDSATLPEAFQSQASETVLSHSAADSSSSLHVSACQPEDTVASRYPDAPDNLGNPEDPEAPATSEAPEASTILESAPAKEQVVVSNVPEEKAFEVYKEMKDGAPEEEKHKSSEENMRTPLKTNNPFPPFDPRSPIGLEFLIPKTGFFCKVCRRFFSGAKEAEQNHCKTIKHYENLQRYFLTTKAAGTTSKMDSS
ncbi:unnamed protein product [Ophioblennius macclurei]